MTLARSGKISTLIIALGEPTTRAFVHDLLASLDAPLGDRVSVEWKMESAAKLILAARDGSALIYALERLLEAGKYPGTPIALFPRDFPRRSRRRLSSGSERLIRRSRSASSREES